jgi:flagellin-like protein
MRNTKKRGISPVIATVILVAIAIVISIAAAFWMTGLLSSFTRYEQVQIVSSYASKSGTNYIIWVNTTNTGSMNVTITNILINDQPYTTYGASITLYVDTTSFTSLPVTFSPAQKCNIRITVATGKFNPGAAVKISIVTAAGHTYDRTVTVP